MDLSKVISLTRKKKGFTQESLAEATNLSLSTIQRIENGKVVPRSYTLKSISDVLGIELFNNLSPTKGTKNDLSDLALLLQASFILVFVPPLNIIFLLRVWFCKMNPDLPSLGIKEILRFQIISFIILVLLVFISPLVTFYLTGQKTFGQINVPLFLYLLYIVANIAISSVIYRNHMLMFSKHQNSIESTQRRKNDSRMT